MLDDLIKIADFLDREGRSSEASLVDYFIRKFAVGGINVGPEIGYIPEDEISDYSSVFNPDGTLKREQGRFDIPEDELEELTQLSDILKEPESVSIEYARNLAKEMSESILDDIV